MEMPVILAMTKFDLSADGEKYRDMKQSDRDALAKKVEQELLVAAISGLRTRDPVEALAMFQDAKGRLDPSVRYQLSERIFADAVPVLAAKVANAGTFHTVVDSEQTASMLKQQGERVGIKVSPIIATGEDKDSVLPADQQLKILLNAQTVMAQDKSQDVARIRDQINNASAAYGAGKIPDILPDPDEVKRVLGPVVGAIALRELDERRRFGDLVSRASKMSRSASRRRRSCSCSCMCGSNTTRRALPAAFAPYIAMSALRSGLVGSPVENRASSATRTWP
jgi:hypothetical protein